MNNRRNAGWLYSWILRSASVDAAVEDRSARFILSARFSLWPAIIISSTAFAHLVGYSFVKAVAIALSLGTIASLGFLINDALDKNIDRANGISRWSVESSKDKRMLTWAIIAGVGGVGSILVFLDGFLVTWLVGISLAILAYSLIFKRTFLVGNVVAAALAVSPGALVVAAHVNSAAGAPELERVPIAVGLLAIGFVLLFSREVRFDEFDERGDRVGGRVTLPMVFGRLALAAMHAILLVVACAGLVVIILVYGRFGLVPNAVGAFATILIVGALLIAGYFSRSKEVFYRVTRIVMIVIPAAIVVCF